MSLLKVNEIQIFNGETVTITAPAVVTANDNTNAALRITQTGLGNALVVEDDTNPDSTPFVVDASGNVGIGTTSPNAKLDNKIYTDSTGLFVFNSKNNGGSSALVDISDDRGFAGNNSGAVARLRGWSTGDDTGSLIEAYTTGDGYTTIVPVLYAKLNGNVGIGTTSPAQKLDVTGNINATGALTLGTALAIAEGGTGATDAATARINLDVDQAGTDNSTDVTLVTTSHDYLSIAGQAITLGPIDLAADVTGTLAASNGGTGVTSLGSLDAADLGSGAATDGYVLTADGAGGTAWEAASGGGATLPIDLLSSGASIRKSDGSTAVLSESGGAVTLENVTNAYLSGGVYLGGTGSANYLDDYEEGTWTPVFTNITGSPTGTARYVKVGQQVTLTFEQTGGTFTCTGGSGYISGIPFLGIGGSGRVSACGAISNTVVTSILALYNASSTGQMYVTGTFSSAGGVGFSITYFV